MLDLLEAPPRLALPPVARHPVLGLPVHATSYADATARIVAWAEDRESRTVNLAGAHGFVDAAEDAELRYAYATADLNAPDGMPLVWALRRAGAADASRVYGPDLMLHVCRAAAEAGIPVGFYGGHPDRLPVLLDRLAERFPDLDVAYAWSPPFRPLTEEEDAEAVAAITESGARIVFVGIGCPKQERWMAAHRGRVPAVMLGVGAAFDFHAGFVRQAPPRLQRLGLEWAFRLAVEPRRLWRRYARVVPRFIWRYATG